VRKYSADGVQQGVARFPLDEQFVYVQENFALAADGEVYSLITRPDRVEVHTLLFFDALPSILPKAVDALPAVSEDGNQESGCSIGRAQIRNNAFDYLFNATPLTATNIDGVCAGRDKPIYLRNATPGTFGSVPYDWGGWDTPSQFNSYMAAGKQAGDRNTSTESCSHGVDCSGFITRIWGISAKKYGTGTLAEISTALSSKASLELGDIFNWAGQHVIMFYEPATDGLIAFESTTYLNRDRVIYLNSDWSRFNSGYVPRRYSSVCAGDPDDYRSFGRGGQLTGAIVPASDQDTYYFDGSVGQSATISLVKHNYTSLDGYLSLYAPDGTLIGQDDDNGGNLNPLMANVRLPQTGRYRVVATSYAQRSVGGYTITVTLTNSGVTCSASQYRAEYFNNRGLSGSPALVRCEGWPINQNWGTGGPGGGINNDDFSVRWTGQASFSSGTYDFIAVTDDGMRVWMDNALIIDGWRDQGATEYRIRRTVSSGTHSFKVEFYEHGGDATARFRWERTAAPPANLALNKTARATSQESSGYHPGRANDGSSSTRWSSMISSSLPMQRWYVDLGSARTFNRVRINWEAAYAAKYRVVWSNDRSTWYFNGSYFTRSSGGWAEHAIGPYTARYVGVDMLIRAPRMNNYSMFEYELYNTGGLITEGTLETAEPVELALPEE
jgi:hypothetical protein